MSFGGKPRTNPLDEPDIAGIDISKTPTNQEAIVLTYVAGEYTVAAHWVSPVYNQRSVEAPDSNSKK